MQIKEALEKLFSLHQFGVKLGLENTINFLDVLGSPQNNLKTFHIAGSNGKGSVSSFIASVLMEKGYKVGLYTSPHFVRFNERVKINNLQIGDEYIADFFTEYFDYIIANGLTFFEVTTAIAFKYFAEQKVDYAVIETGLGGRLDSTNVIAPIASCITSISLEHTKILGDTLAKIAAEKAGIIKPGSKVFIGRLSEEAKHVIEKKCIDLSVPLFEIADYTSANNDTVTFADGDINIDDLYSPLQGEHQKYNAALAVLTLVESMKINDTKLLLRGLQNVLKNTGLEGRYENYFTKPRVILESAHNIEGVEVFLKEFMREEKSFRKKTLLFGVMRDKSLEGMIKKLAVAFDKIVVTEIEYERCARIAELMPLMSKLGIDAESTLEPDVYINEFIKKAGSEDCLVVLGSMYVLGEIKTRFSKQNA
jgi:dihydrofolate synthase / folylpolyglutamate synthase